MVITSVDNTGSTGFKSVKEEEPWGIKSFPYNAITARIKQREGIRALLNFILKGLALI
jgi:hypothetical protein